MTITINNTEIYYEAIGSGIPVLFIHGWGVDHRLMKSFEPAFTYALSGRFMRIYVDLPGMGKSTHGAEIHSTDDIIGALIAFSEKLIPKQKFVIVGESYGGYITRGIAKKIPERILGMALLCPCVKPGYRENTREEKLVLERDEAFMSSLPSEQREAFEEMAVLETREAFGLFMEEIYPSFELADWEFLKHGLKTALPFDPDSHKTPFNKPVLFIVARRDHEVGYKEQFELLEKYPHASYIVLDRAGHNLQIEQRGILLAIFGGWLSDNYPAH